jgi:hypothetical protein
MIFEVNSIKVAKGIEYLVRCEKFQSYNLVVLLPVDGKPFPRMCHSKEWKKVREYPFAGIADEIIERYKKLNAVVLLVKYDKIVLVDLIGFFTLELKCSYKGALSYLEYVLL